MPCRRWANHPAGQRWSCPVQVKQRAPEESSPRGHAGFPEPASAGRAASVRLAGYPTLREALNAPAGLLQSPERVWVESHLKVVRYRVTNNTGMARNIAESDFWQSGIRGVLFGEASRQLMAGGALRSSLSAAEVRLIANINSVVKRKQFIWLGIVLATVGVVGGGGWYLADARYEGSSDAAAAGEPAPDMTGVVDSTFDQKVQQHATTEMQATASGDAKQYAEMRRRPGCSARGRQAISTRLTKLSQDNAALSAQVSALGAKPVTASGVSRPRSRQCLRRGLKVSRSRPVSRRRRGAVPPPPAFYPR